MDPYPSNWGFSGFQTKSASGNQVWAPLFAPVARSVKG